MDETIGVVSGLPTRRDALVGSLAGPGWKVLRLEGVPGSTPCDLLIVDVAETSPGQARQLIERWRQTAPILAVAPIKDLPTLEASVEAGAADLAIAPTPRELITRVNLLLGVRTRRQRALNRDRALVELAAAAGETLEPTTVLRAILSWIQTSLPGTEAEIVLTSPVAGGRIRVIRPGPGATLVFGHTVLENRPDLHRALAGEKVVHLADEAQIPALAPLKANLEREGFADLVALSLYEGDGASALVVRSRQPIEADELALIRAAAALSSRSLVHARSFEALEMERERLERAWADRYHELLETNQRLRRVANQKDELLEICAHDLRLPVDAIRANVRELSDREPALSSGIRRQVEAIDTNAQRLEEILDDLLDLHGVETGRLELKPQMVDIGSLARDVCEALKLTAVERGVKIEVRVPSSGPVLKGDPSKLQEVIANLLHNALRFSPPAGTVEVAVEALARGGARVVVADDGPGIPQETLASLLAGVQPRGADAPGGGLRGQSRGLGLAIAREIALLHGGRLTGSSEVGKGSIFSVELPLEPIPAEKPRASEAPRQEKAKAVPTVLVVEDDDDVRQLLVDLLEDDHEVLQACDGEEGIRKAREERPDVILMDLYLPRLDGFAALEELKRDPETADLAVVFLSAEKGESTRVRGLDLGAEDFLVKPFSSVELRARIARALRSARQQEQLRAIAQTDALTGLPNYRAFRARLEEETKRARRYQTSLAAVMVDMDNLKPINDRLGHSAGNRAIVALAEAVVSQLRETDFAARYGGDEFVLLLPHTTASEALAMAERLRRAIHRIDWEGGIAVRASLGVAALIPSAGEASAEALIRAADSALYRAKHQGRDQVCLAGQGSLEESRRP